MPGIVGILNKFPDKESHMTIRRMLSSMEHGVWYKSGTHLCGELGFHIGWVNHDGEFADCMPIVNESQDLVLCLSGEVFHDPAVIEGLKNKGHQFSGGNGSYLIHLYEEQGDKFISELNGWFSGVLLDYRQRRVLLFNDRYGMNRIFIHEGRDGLYFASEAKALLAAVPEVREFDPKGLGEFLTCECTLGTRSLYKNVAVLPGGSLWVLGDGEVKKKSSYFNPREWVDERKLGEEQFSYRLVELFGGVVNRYSGGSLSLGISLTGGLDSRMVMACMDMRTSQFPCYTFGSLYRDTFDVQVAREVAKACGQPHHTLILGEEFVRELPHYVEKAVYISDGYIGLPGAAELYVNALARNIAPVRLTGNYGGELLRGDRSFKYKVPHGRFVTLDLKPYLVEAQTTFKEFECTDAVTFALFRQAPSQGYGRLTIERSQVIPRTPFMDNDLVKLVYQAPPRLLKGEELSVAILSRYKPDLLKIPTDRGLLFNGTTIRRLTRRLHREALIKAEYWSSHGMPNGLAAISRYGLGRFLEKGFLGRNKFQHFRLWTQTRLNEHLNDLLLQGGRELKDFFDLRQVETMVRHHLAGRQNYVDEIDKLLTIILTHHTLLKGADSIINGSEESIQMFGAAGEGA